MFHHYFHRHANFAAAMHGNPHFYRHWHRGPSRLLWFIIGAGSATAFIAHKEAHEGEKSRYWGHCFRAPIQVPQSLPSSPNQSFTPGPVPHTSEPEHWQRWIGRPSDQQIIEEKERLANLKRQAQDTVRSLLPNFASLKLTVSIGLDCF